MLPNKVTDKIKGLDSIRFIAAFIVTIGHFGNPPIFMGANENNTIVRLAIGFYNNFFNGPAAVIVFFVISGFCIHFPYAKGKQMDMPNFYIKRMIRILIPMIVVMVMSTFLHIETDLHTSIFWSLFAEVIYYILYPFLLKLSKKYKWNSLVVISYILSYSLIFYFMFINPIKDNGNYPQYGFLNFILGLPCWLLGVKLADSFTHSESKIISVKRITIYRFGVWIASVLFSILRFHTTIGYNVSLNIFAIVVYLWLQQEILYYQNREPSKLLENAGKWSYSLYLIHLFTYWVYAFLPNFGPLVNLFLGILTALIDSYIFYLIVEKPSHKLSQRFSLQRLKIAS